MSSQTSLEDIDVDNIDSQEELIEVLQAVIDELMDQQGRIRALHNARAHLLERTEELDDRVDQFEEAVADVQLETIADGGDKPYKKLSREEKVQRIRMSLVEQAQQNPTKKAMMEFGDVKWLFDARPSTGHVYDLMKVAGTEPGFDYQEFEQRNNRITVNLDAVNDESLVHAVNSRQEAEGD